MKRIPSGLNSKVEGLLRNHHPSRLLFAQETFWPGNTSGHPNYSDEDVRRNAFVILFSAAMILDGDMDGNSSSGLGISMEPNDAIDKIVMKLDDVTPPTDPL